jgi:putative NIF3 family GTP cyclohydrolase 1 type 2
MNTQEIMKLALNIAELREILEDSVIYVSGENIHKVLFGIDAGVPELLLAKQLDYDAVIAHHPQGGTASVNFQEVFKRHVQQMVEVGIPLKEAEKAVRQKLEDLEVDGHTRNYGHAVDAARLLKMPYMNIHTPLDEVGRRVMARQITRRTRKDATVQDVVAALNELPEFKNAVTKVKIRLGRADNSAGRVVVSHGAGTNGGHEVTKAYFKHGVGTVVYIHIGVEDLRRLKTDQKTGNLIVTGHIASDSIGINPFIRELKKKEVSVTTIGIIPEEGSG